MPPQIPCLRGCIITLVAFVWLFSTVGFHVGPFHDDDYEDDNDGGDNDGDDDGEDDGGW